MKDNQQLEKDKNILGTTYNRSTITRGCLYVAHINISTKPDELTKEYPGWAEEANGKSYTALNFSTEDALSYDRYY